MGGRSGPHRIAQMLPTPRPIRRFPPRLQHLLIRAWRTVSFIAVRPESERLYERITFPIIEWMAYIQRRLDVMEQAPAKAEPPAAVVAFVGRAMAGIPAQKLVLEVRGSSASLVDALGGLGYRVVSVPTLDAMPLPEGAFAAVVMVEASSGAVAATASAAHSLLKPGGVLVLSIAGRFRESDLRGGWRLVESLPVARTAPGRQPGNGARQPVTIVHAAAE